MITVLESVKISITIQNITLMFVSGHVDIRDNERVDSLATISEGQPFDHADNISNLRHIEKMEGFGGSE